jgi:hypothetical protein
MEIPYRRVGNTADEMGTANNRKQELLPTYLEVVVCFLELPSTVRDEEGPHISSRKLPLGHSCVHARYTASWRRDVAVLV